MTEHGDDLPLRPLTDVRSVQRRVREALQVLWLQALEGTVVAGRHLGNHGEPVSGTRTLLDALKYLLVLLN